MPRPRNVGRPPAVLGTSSASAPCYWLVLNALNTDWGPPSVLAVSVALANYVEDIFIDHVTYIMASSCVSRCGREGSFPLYQANSLFQSFESRCGPSSSTALSSASPRLPAGHTLNAVAAAGLETQHACRDTPALLRTSITPSACLGPLPPRR